MACEQTKERERLEALQREVSEAQEAHDKCAANLDTREKEIQATEAKAAADLDAFPSVEHRARQALGSIRREELTSPFAAPSAGYAELSSKLAEELEGASCKVDAILESECRSLLSLAATSVFSHLFLRNPDFDFSEVIGPVPEESRASTAESVAAHTAALVGKFSCSGGDKGSEDDAADDDEAPGDAAADGDAQPPPPAS